MRRSEIIGTLYCRHVDVRTSPQHCYVFTLRTHPAVQPGMIAFNAPQVVILCAFYTAMMYDA